MPRWTTLLFLVAFAVAGSWGPALHATDEASEDDLKQANNPLADFSAFNIQNYHVADIYGVPDQTANEADLRYITPISRWLLRVTLPLKTAPVAGQANPVTGLGDLSAFAAYLFNEDGADEVFGVGPLLVADTATDDALGTGKWQLGAAAVYFDSSSAKFQYGGLFQFSTSVAGDSNRAEVSTLVLQPFGFWQLGKGTYLRTSPLWVFDTRNGNYNVPFGLGIGKVIKTGYKVFNIFFEPQFAVLNYGVNQPAFQIFAGMNVQFK